MEIPGHRSDHSVITRVLEREMEELSEVRGRGSVETERIGRVHFENRGRGHRPMHSDDH